jgi:SAM-dependent methyltransferase
MNQIMHMQRAETWDEFSATYEAFAEPITSRFGIALADRLGIRPDERVLDIAAGSGALSLELARRGARVTAVDHSAAMTGRIAERARLEGVQIDARAMDGQALDFVGADFDVALSVFGIMLFPDHEAGLRELVRVLQPGGRAGLAVWRSAGGAGPACLLREAAASLSADQTLPEMPLGHQLWRDPERLRADLAAAGLQDIDIVEMSEDWEFPSLDWVADNAPRLFAVMPIWTGADEPQRERLLAHVLEQLRAMDRPVIPSPALLATAHKP